MKLLKKYYGTLLLVILCLIPIALWLNNFGFGSPFKSLAIFIASLGKATALIGITLFFVNPVLSMRHSWLESLFGGLDNLYRLHAKSGKYSFLFILCHPIFLGVGRMLDGKRLSSVWDWSSFLIWTGIISTILLILTTSFAIYAHVRHQQWILVHRLFGWLIVLFFIHAVVARSQLIKAPWLLPYMSFIGSVGFSAFLYRSVLYKSLVKKFHYSVTEINYLSPTVMELVLKPLAVPITFQAGQFAFLSFNSPVIDTEAHPFSFSNANNGPYIRFTIKVLGDDTKKLQQITAGTTVNVEGPYGKFSYRNSRNKKQVWIAGGIGITPFLSMARSFSTKEQYKVRFFYGTESLDEAVFLQEFIDITRHLPENFDTRVVSKNMSGFVTVEKLKKSLDNLAEFDYFICGPPAMMKILRDGLTKSGVEPSQIHIEEFSY